MRDAFEETLEIQEPVENGPDTEALLNIESLKRTHALFSQLKAGMIREIMYESEVTMLKPEEVLYENGGYGEQFFIILFGRLCF